MRLLLCMICLISFSSCGPHAPKVTACIYEANALTFHCVNPAGNAFDMPASSPQADKLACLPWSDLGIIASYCQSLKNNQLQSPKMSP